MSVFLDTGVLYAHHDPDATRNDAATALFDAVLAGEYGQPYTNDYVFSETVTLTRRRTDDFEATKAIADRILGVDPFPDIIDLKFVRPRVFEDAIDCLERYDDQGLSFTDAAAVAHAREIDVDYIASFDDDFDGVYDRLDPDDPAV